MPHVLPLRGVPEADPLEPVYEEKMLEDDDVTTRQPIRVLLLFPQRLIGEALQRSLDEVPGLEHIGTATSIETAMEAIQFERPDVLVAAAVIATPPGAAQSIRDLTTQTGTRVVLVPGDAGPSASLVAPVLGATVVPFDGTLDDVMTAIAGAEDAAPAPARPSLSEAVRQLRSQVGTQRSMIRSVQQRLDATKVVRRSEVVHELTKRENDVLLLLQAGKDVKAIARHLGISTNTVRGHVKQILWKLGAHSQLEAVNKGVRAGLLQGRAENLPL